MLKLPDNLSISPGPVPVGRVLPVLAVDGIGATLQELNARATQFILGREYSAQVVSKVDDKAYLVKVDSAVLKMELGNTALVGQSIRLRYVQDSPVPTFFFTPPTGKPAYDSAELSSAARLIGQLLQEAEKNGVSGKYEAAAVVTHSPKDPQMVAQGLKQAVANSGLFYESHLSEMLQGGRSLTAIMQEPQNQAQQTQAQIATLTSQQLAILEQNRLNWHGEVWPGQKMEWDVYLEQRDGESAEQGSEREDVARPVVSEIKLTFPHLGVVAAKLTIVDGHVSINLRAEQSETLDALKSKSRGLTQAMSDSGLQVEGLVISVYE
ncbi:flagellar hook-length control protein FliK [Methylotenera sp. L2L1]|uniref:flagellar hook-length control protein FliK n=1 Tax=Methylotenera sp. L2L1 TaxID=1502770 RepID=UPI00056B472D|nr:flagellar hook-length control protein FliK [Methylotenera sp. L2L1]